MILCHFSLKLRVQWVYQCALSPNFMIKNRTFATVTANLNQKYKVVILGAGTGGITVAAQLARDRALQNNILLVDSREMHYYQPLWTLVGAGLTTLAESAKPTQAVIPPTVQWLQDSVKSVDPHLKSITTNAGKTLDFDYLVVAAGLTLDWERIAGLKEALGRDGVSSSSSCGSGSRFTEIVLEQSEITE